MKFTINWLKEHLDTKLDDQKIIDKLTSIGLEVESFESQSSELDKFIVAKIIKAEKHFAPVVTPKTFCMRSFSKCENCIVLLLKIAFSSLSWQGVDKRVGRMREYLHCLHAPGNRCLLEDNFRSSGNRFRTIAAEMFKISQICGKSGKNIEAP